VARSDRIVRLEQLIAIGDERGQIVGTQRVPVALARDWVDVAHATGCVVRAPKRTGAPPAQIDREVDQVEDSPSYEGTSFTITSLSGADPSGVALPAGYIGSVYTLATSGSNLPKQVTAIEGIDVTFSSHAGAVSGTYHSRSVLWLSAGPRTRPTARCR
jgi:hypothetical protein